MDTGVENAFYIFAEDGTDTKYARCTTTNFYTYVVEEEENEVLVHSMLVGKETKSSTID